MMQILSEILMAPEFRGWFLILLCRGYITGKHIVTPTIQSALQIKRILLIDTRSIQ